MSFDAAKALNTLLEAGFSHVMLRYTDKEPGIYIPPQFFIGALPPKRKGNDPDNNERADNYPFICTRIVDGEDGQDASIIRMETFFGAHTVEDDEAGHQEIVNMIMRARRIILEKQILENLYRLVFPVKWSIGDPEDGHAQPHPNYEGVIRTTWEIPAVEQIISIEYEENIYGNKI